eukprot:9542725-Prorocentrum_lima.AAC.1
MAGPVVSSAAAELDDYPRAAGAAILVAATTFARSAAAIVAHLCPEEDRRENLRGAAQETNMGESNTSAQMGDVPTDDSGGE